MMDAPILRLGIAFINAELGSFLNVGLRTVKSFDREIRLIPFTDYLLGSWNDNVPADNFQ